MGKSLQLNLFEKKHQREKYFVNLYESCKKQFKQNKMLTFPYLYIIVKR